jgi:hypothetical protein
MLAFASAYPLKLFMQKSGKKPLQLILLLAVPSALTSSSLSQLPSKAAFAWHHTRIIHPDDLAAPKNGIDIYHAVLL